MEQEQHFDYSEFEDSLGDLPEDRLERLRTLALRQIDAQRNLDSCVARVEEATKGLNKIKLELLPELMDELKLEQFKTEEGFELKIATAIRASIPEANLEKACTWLEERNHGRLIKRTFNIEFGKDQESWANKFERDCAKRKRPLNLKRKKGVHPQTLSAFVRGQLEEGIDIPTDLFGIFRQRSVNVKVPE